MIAMAAFLPEVSTLLFGARLSVDHVASLYLGVAFLAASVGNSLGRHILIPEGATQGVFYSTLGAPLVGIPLSVWLAAELRVGRATAALAISQVVVVLLITPRSFRVLRDAASRLTSRSRRSRAGARWSAGRTVNCARRFQPRALVPARRGTVRVARLGPATPGRRPGADAVRGRGRPTRRGDRTAGRGVHQADDLARREPVAPRAGHPAAGRRAASTSAACGRRATAYIISFAHHGDYEGITPLAGVGGIPTPLSRPRRCSTRGAGLDAAAGAGDLAAGRHAARRRRAARPASGGARAGAAVASATDIPATRRSGSWGTTCRWPRGPPGSARMPTYRWSCVTAHPRPGQPSVAGSLTGLGTPAAPGSFDSVEDLLGGDGRASTKQPSVAWPEAAEYMPLRRS